MKPFKSFAEEMEASLVGTIKELLEEECLAESDWHAQYQKHKAALDAEYAHADHQINTGAWKRGSAEIKAHVKRATALLNKKNKAWERHLAAKSE